MEYKLYDASAIGAAIRDLRRAKGISQASLANATGINRTYLSNLEQGRFSEQLGRLFAIFRQLGAHVAVVIEEGGPTAASGAR